MIYPLSKSSQEHKLLKVCFKLKHSFIIINYGRKFFSTGHWRQSYKNYGRNLRIFVKSQSVCPWPNLTFVGKAAAYAKVEQLKHSSLLRKFGNYGRKMFYKISPWGQCYKIFFVRNLRIFVISQSVCPWQAFQAQSNVCG